MTKSDDKAKGPKKRKKDLVILPDVWQKIVQLVAKVGIFKDELEHLTFLAYGGDQERMQHVLEYCYLLEWFWRKGQPAFYVLNHCMRNT